MAENVVDFPNGKPRKIKINTDFEPVANFELLLKMLSRAVAVTYVTPAAIIEFQIKVRSNFINAAASAAENGDVFGKFWLRLIVERNFQLVVVKFVEAAGHRISDFVLAVAAINEEIIFVWYSEQEIPVHAVQHFPRSVSDGFNFIISQVNHSLLI